LAAFGLLATVRVVFDAVDDRGFLAPLASVRVLDDAAVRDVVATVRVEAPATRPVLDAIVDEPRATAEPALAPIVANLEVIETAAEAILF
jgi:hypothetical protein